MQICRLILNLLVYLFDLEEVENMRKYIFRAPSSANTS